MSDSSEFIKVEVTDGNQSKVFQAALVKFQSDAKGIIPDIPILPNHSSEYEGWFAQTKKVIAMRKQTTAAGQQLELVKSFTNLYAEYHNISEVLLKIQKNKNEMDKEKQRSNLVNTQMDVERLDLEAKKSEHELSIARNKADIEKLKTPGQASSIDRKKQELEEAQLDAQIQKVKPHESKRSGMPPYIEQIINTAKSLELVEKARELGKAAAPSVAEDVDVLCDKKRQDILRGAS